MEQTPIMSKIEVIPKAPEIELVAWWKISMYGYPVGLARAALRLPRQNSTAINMLNLSAPLMRTDSRTALRIATNALRTSLVIWFSSAIKFLRAIKESIYI
jgi:hypothetical protein